MDTIQIEAFKSTGEPLIALPNRKMTEAELLNFLKKVRRVIEKEQKKKKVMLCV